MGKVHRIVLLTLGWEELPKAISVYGAPQNAAAIDKYRNLGVTRVIFRLRAEGRDVVLPKLDRLTKLV